jgi:hypothetical protein
VEKLTRHVREGKDAARVRQNKQSALLHTLLANVMPRTHQVTQYHAKILEQFPSETVLVERFGRPNAQVVHELSCTDVDNGLE